MRTLTAYFVRGLVVAAPLGLTVYVCWVVFSRIDRWLGLPYPGAGFVATVALVTLLGWMASSILTRALVGFLDRVLTRLPFVRLLYGSTRDLLNAFVGEKRRFDTPVLVTLYPGGSAKAFGFVTQETLDRFGLADHVAVYFPQSYNFAGSLVVYPADQVRPVVADSADVMAFIVSGGVTDVPRVRRAE